VLKDGILYCKALSNDACPVEAKSLAEITSIGSAVVVLLLEQFLSLLQRSLVMLVHLLQIKQHQF
jgi:hypothetical protein